MTGVFHVPSDLSDDERAVMSEVTRVLAEGTEEISDACARTIASWFHNGQASAGYAFTSTGAITTDDPSDLWRELGGDTYADQRPWMRAALDCLGTYLTNRRASREAVPGWSTLWVR